MKKLLLILFLFPFLSFAQEVDGDFQMKPFIGEWENKTKNYEILIKIIHEPKFPLIKLKGPGEGFMEVLFFDFYFRNKENKQEIRINSIESENYKSIIAFPSPDQMPNMVISWGDNSYKYKLKAISENEIELINNEEPRYEVDIVSKQSRIIPKEPIPIPDRIVLKRAMN